MTAPNVSRSLRVVVAAALVVVIAGAATSARATTVPDAAQRPELEVGGELPFLDEQAGSRPPVPTTDEEVTTTTEDESGSEGERDEKDQGSSDRTSTTETTAPGKANDETPVPEGDSTDETDETDVTDDASEDGKGGALVLGLLGGLLAGAALGAGAMALLRRGSPTPPAAAPLPATPVAGDAQRSALVTAIIEVRDSVPSEALRERLGRALQDVGVQEITVQAGQPFDPQWHRAVDTTPTSNPAQVNTVATTERPGYVDGTTTLRLPEVIVYRPQ